MLELEQTSIPLAHLADLLAADVFRTDTSRPGFASYDFGSNLSPRAFRAMLVELAEALDAIYRRDFPGRRLLLRSIGRFSQVNSTEAHLDGAPDESILLLGYEPSEVERRLRIYDYVRCAADRGMSPREFLDGFNPTFSAGRAAIEPYAVGVWPFDRRHYRVVLINNSSAPIERGAAAGMLGVLHQGDMLAAPPGQARHVNTLIFSTDGAGAPDLMPDDALRAYVESGAFRMV
jgi:hypothetical protein